MSTENQKNLFVRVVKISCEAVREVFKTHPIHFASFIGITLFYTCMPALQIMVIRHAVNVYQADSNRTMQSIGIVAGAIAFCAVFLALTRAIAAKMREMLWQKMSTHYNSMFSEMLCRLTPQQTLDNQIGETISGARNGIEWSISYQAAYTIDIIGALLSVVTLVATMWLIHPLAAILIALALVPDLLAYYYSSKKYDDV